MISSHRLKQLTQRAIQIWQQEGIQSLSQRARIRLLALAGINSYGNFDHGYQSWVERHPPRKQKEINDTLQQLTYQPTISIIVPVYNVEKEWLLSMIESVTQQSYPKWQLCLADDCSPEPHIWPALQKATKEDQRIKIFQNPENTGIAITSNNAANIADGEYLALLDHDDRLHPDALLENVLLLNNHPETDLIYSDEDKLSLNDKRHTPFFKPDLNPDLLYSQNYIGHFVVLRKTLFDQIGGFEPGVDGAQDYDLLLRTTDATTKIKHIAKPLYHWRQIDGSTAQAFSEKSYAWEAGRLALEHHLQKKHHDINVSNGEYPGTYHVHYPIEPKAKVSILIPFKDKPELLEQCLASIEKHCSWDNLEIIAIDNQSTLPETKALLESKLNSLPYFKCLTYDNAFNFSAICNAAAKQASGEYLLFMNNDIEIISDHFIEHLLQHARRDDIGAVGAKLLYPNRTIQHAGIAIGIGGSAGHVFKHFPANHPGYFLRNALVHNVSAVTAALLMIEKSKFDAVGGFDENDFAIAFNDVDLCLKLAAKQWRNLYTPYCTAIHHESASRGSDTDSKNAQRFEKEKQALQQKWQHYFKNGDPYYNPNLTHKREDYSLNHVRTK